MLGGVAQADAPETQPTLPKAFSQEAPRAWEKLDKGLQHVGGNFISEYKSLVKRAPGKPEFKTDLKRRKTYKVNRDLNAMTCIHTVIESARADPAKAGETVNGENNEYSFQVTQSEKGGKFWLSQFARSGKNEELSNVNNMGLRRHLDVAQRVMGSKIADLLSGKEGRVTSAEWVDRGGKRHLRLGVELKSKKGDFYPASAILDPEHGWRVVEYTYEYKLSPHVLRGVVEYHEGLEFSFPSKIVEENLDENGVVEDREVMTFSKPVNVEYKAEEFRLEAFGLEAPIQTAGEGG